MLAEQKDNTNIGIGFGVTLMLTAGKLVPTFFPDAAVLPTRLGLLAGLGALLYLWGCANFAAGKGHSRLWLVVAFIPFLGLIILVLLSDRHAESPAPRRGSMLSHLAIVSFLCSLGLSIWTIYNSSHPASVEEAQRWALKRYPELGIADSPLNREFITRYKRYKSTKTDYFDDPNWPQNLADESYIAIKGRHSR